MTRGSESNTNILSTTFVVLVFVNLAQSMGQQMMVAVVPLYAYDLGASASLVGAVVGAFAITALAVRPFAGPAFDSFSKKKMLCASFAVMAAATFFYGLSNSVVLLLLARLFHGIGIGFAGPLALSLVTESVPVAHLASGVSIYMVAQAVAQAIGPAIGIWLSRAIGYQDTFFLAAAYLALAGMLVVGVKEQDKTRLPYRIRLGRIFAKGAVGPSAVQCLLAMAFSCTGAYVAIFGELRNVADIGLYFTVYAVCLLLTRPLYGRLADRLGITVVLVPGIAFFALSFMLISGANTLSDFLIAAAVAACGYGACSPLIQAVAISAAPDDLRGAASNTSYAGLDIGTMSGPMIGGAAVESLVPVLGGEAQAYAAMWLVMMIPIALALLLFTVLKHKGLIA